MESNNLDTCFFAVIGALNLAATYSKISPKSLSALGVNYYIIVVHYSAPYLALYLSNTSLMGNNFAPDSTSLCDSASLS